jgi:hypothetical protein
VIAARGGTSPSEQEYVEALNEAHKALGRQPGPDLSRDPPILDIASSMLKIARSLREPRNQYGTGHGRAVAPDIHEEVVHVAIDASMTWCRWALRRLKHLIAGEPNGLARDLDNMVSFTRESIAARLAAADLRNLDGGVQHRLGLAVAHRAMAETFVVAQEGLEACAGSMDMATWPVGYRLGLADGLFLNRAGQVDATTYGVEQAARVLAPVQSVGDWLNVIAERIGQATMSYRLSDPATAHEVVGAMSRAARHFRNDDQQAWNRIAAQLNAAILP